MSRDTGFIKFSFLHFIGVFIGLNLKLNCELLGDFMDMEIFYYQNWILFRWSCLKISATSW